MKIEKFKFNEIGFNCFFGLFEVKIMMVLWNGSEMFIKDV